MAISATNKQIKKLKCNTTGCKGTGKAGDLTALCQDGIFLTCWCRICKEKQTKIISN